MRIDSAQDRSMVASAAGRAARRPWLRLLNAVLQLAGGRAELVSHCERAWASATFSGARHTIVLAFEGADALADGERFIDALPEHEFAIPGQLVAEAAIVSVCHEAQPRARLCVEAVLLLVEET